MITASDVDGHVTEDVGAHTIDSGITVYLTDSGAISFTDVDTDDVSTATVALTGTPSTTGPAIPTALSNALATAMALTGATHAHAGEVDWTFAVDDSLVQYLAKDETVTATYTISVKDDFGDSATDTSTQTVTITITGTNDRPVITAGDVDGHVTEDVGAHTIDSGSTVYLTDSGAISFTDVDTDDVSTATVALTGTLSTTGPAIPTALSDALATAMAFTGATHAHAGEVDWTFAVDDSLVQYLAKDETVTATYTISVKDNSGDSATDTSTQTVTITITGTNDAPTLFAVTGPTYVDTANADTFVAATGSLVGADVDDAHNLTYGINAGTSDTSQSGFDLSKSSAYGILYLNSTTGAYEFVPDTDAINALKTTVTTGFTVTVTDDQNATSSQTLTVTLSGVNDTPDVNPVTTTAIDSTGPESGTVVASGNVITDVSDSDRDHDLLVVSAVAGSTPDGHGNFVAAGSYGTLTVHPDGTYGYVANDAFDALAIGGAPSDVFTFTVTDGQAPVDRTLTINIDVTNSGINHAPTLAVVTGLTFVDSADADTFTAATGALVGADVDDNTTLTYGITGGDTDNSLVGYNLSKVATYGTLYVNTLSGAYDFVPDNNAINALKTTVSENFTVTVTDEHSAASSQIFTVT